MSTITYIFPSVYHFTPNVTNSLNNSKVKLPVDCLIGGLDNETSLNNTKGGITGNLCY